MAERKTELKRTVMPNQEEMMDRVRTVGLSGKGGSVDNFFEELIKRTAGKEIDGYELNLQWTYAAAETLSQRSAVFEGLVVRLHFDQIITAITSDFEVLTQAREIRQRYIEELNKANRAERDEWEHLAS